MKMICPKTKNNDTIYSSIIFVYQHNSLIFLDGIKVKNFTPYFCICIFIVSKLA